MEGGKCSLHERANVMCNASRRLKPRYFDTLTLQQDVEFSPPLPEKKVKAFRRMGMCHVAKVILKFERPVLPPLLHGCICSESFIPEFWFRWDFKWLVAGDVNNTTRMSGLF